MIQSPFPGKTMTLQSSLNSDILEADVARNDLVRWKLLKSRVRDDENAGDANAREILWNDGVPSTSAITELDLTILKQFENKMIK